MPSIAALARVIRLDVGRFQVGLLLGDDAAQQRQRHHRRAEHERELAKPIFITFTRQTFCDASGNRVTGTIAHLRSLIIPSSSKNAISDIAQPAIA